MASEPPKEEQEEGAPAWMLTYGDMVTLILTFFVLLISIMVVDPKKFVEVLGTYKDETGDGANRVTEDLPQKTKDYFMQIIKVAARRSEVLEGGDDVTQEGEAVRVFAFEENYIKTMAEQPFFERFKVTLTENGKRRLTHLASKITALNGGHNIRIVGHYAPDEEKFGSLLQPISYPNHAEKTQDDDETRPELTNGMTQALVVEYEVRNAGTGFSEGVPLQRVTRFVFEPRDLAHLRAEAVRDFLISKGVSSAGMESVTGRPIRSNRVYRKAGATAVQFKKSGKYLRKSGEASVDILENTAEASSALKEQPNIEGQTFRPWPQFIFVDSGSDQGRLVEIIVSGKLSR